MITHHTEPREEHSACMGSLERTAAALYLSCGRASRVRRDGRPTALHYLLRTCVMVHQDVGTLDYRIPSRRRSRARIFWVATGIAAAVWCLALLVPYAIIGESWGFMWMLLSLPLSGYVHSRYGIGRDSYGWIGLITLVN